MPVASLDIHTYLTEEDIHDNKLTADEKTLYEVTSAIVDPQTAQWTIEVLVGGATVVLTKMITEIRLYDSDKYEYTLGQRYQLLSALQAGRERD